MSWLCYFDESGDSGYNDSGTKAYALAGVLLQDASWLPALDDAIGFRRFLKQAFGIQMRDEVKSNYLLNNKGPIKRLNMGSAMRTKIFRMSLRLIPKLADGQGIKVFAVVVDKAAMAIKDPTSDPRRLVWERAIERLERFTHYQKDNCLIFPDEGNYDVIRSIVREKRRFNQVPSQFGTASLSRPAAFVLEDPSSRRSHESYLVQLADFAAYAAFRAIYPRDHPLDGSLWDLLGDARLSEVNKYSGGPPGLVLWPARPRK